MLDAVLEAASLVAQPETIFFVFLGIIVGQILGVIPGLTATMVMALIMPITFAMPIWVGVPMLLGMLKGALFGGSLAAIFIKTPGTPAAMATILDGHPLAQQGKGRKAAKLALLSSTFGDVFGTLCLIFATGFLATIALKLGPPELLLIALSALIVLGTVSGKSPRLGLMSAGAGLLLASIGLDPVTGVSRLNFGITQLLSGIELIPMLIGLLTIPEIIRRMEQNQNNTSKTTVSFSEKPEDNKLHWWEIKKTIRTLFRSSAIGTAMGAIPGLGANIAAFIGYNQAATSSKHSQNFGKGEIEGVAATESANSSEGGANMIPLLALGIPGDTAVAVVASAFLLHGITVGPTVFVEAPVEIYAIFIALFIAGIFNFIVGQGLIPIATKVLQIKQRLLFPSVFIMAVAGTFGMRASLFDVGIMMLFGFIGYVMVKLDIPLIPLLIAFLIGPMVEKNLQRTSILIDANDSFLFLFQRPAFLILLVVFILMSYLVIRFQRKVST
ncbi:tripartite tricarboxylate transporter permease [Alteribacillus sp. YIM 98480]|uniref:tripartite tricarboxylate transporter permease n=1 Tax=Alteribacillus sp. YIM 98480 TaxID=2606599 RepID=UPI00131CA592|nr:tripartite tricarboxylate transporter permease [Alteribacillus sp. YIM 98480]